MVKILNRLDPEVENTPRSPVSKRVKRTSLRSDVALTPERGPLFRQEVSVNLPVLNVIYVHIVSVI